MRAIITLDRYDGSQGKSKEIDLESFPMRELIYALMESDVCGFTVTKVNTPEKLIRKLDELRG
jgi:hypothetical protein